MKPQISIIIPVYNVENYITKCLDSVLEQGLTDYEVLLVDDGSTDGSVSICEAYCREHKQFRLLQQENSGVAKARNHGIDEAKGKFIVFLDADDYLLSNGYNLAFQPFADREDLDVIHFYSSYDFWEKKPIENDVIYDGTGHGWIMKGDLPSFCWLCFYRKSFLDQHHIRFKHYIVGEDQLFASSVYLANPRFASTNANIYRYVVRNSSATTKRSESHSRRCVDDYINSYADIIEFMLKHGVTKGSDIYNVCLTKLNSKKVFGVSRMLSSSYSYSQFKRVKEKCRAVSFYPVLPYSNGWKHHLQIKTMNGVMRHFAIYKVSSWVFNMVVVPYILPKLRVNL